MNLLLVHGPETLDSMNECYHILRLRGYNPEAVSRPTCQKSHSMALAAYMLMSLSHDPRQTVVFLPSLASKDRSLLSDICGMYQVQALDYHALPAIAPSPGGKACDQGVRGTWRRVSLWLRGLEARANRYLAPWLKNPQSARAALRPYSLPSDKPTTTA